MRIHDGCILTVLTIGLWGNQAGTPAGVQSAQAEPAGVQPAQAAQRSYSIPTGTKIPLQLINSVSTKTAAVGDRLYLQTNFPILAEGRIVIPPGAYVTGTVTLVKRAG